MVSGGNSNHIHVGSMRCSFDFEGHARAPICGTGKSIVPTFEPELHFAFVDYQYVTGVRLMH